MANRCSECGAILSSYNTGQVCFPCQKKRKDSIVDRIVTSKCERLEYLDFLLVSKTGEKIRALPQKVAAASGMHLKPLETGPAGDRQESLETIERNLHDWKPRVQISLNPLAVRGAHSGRSSTRNGRA
ncbi:MAG: hypothetical protein JXA46_04705 [Dehalococcoidales bacterium]|nr:hypothetical protein [Dehalococcoidales bacterium]